MPDPRVLVHLRHNIRDPAGGVSFDLAFQPLNAFTQVVMAQAVSQSPLASLRQVKVFTWE
jgi:hypothetical protein